MLSKISQAQPNLDLRPPGQLVSLYLFTYYPYMIVYSKSQWLQVDRYAGISVCKQESASGRMSAAGLHCMVMYITIISEWWRIITLQTSIVSNTSKKKGKNCKMSEDLHGARRLDGKKSTTTTSTWRKLHLHASPLTFQNSRVTWKEMQFYKNWNFIYRWLEILWQSKKQNCRRNATYLKTMATTLRQHW